MKRCLFLMFLFLNATHYCEGQTPFWKTIDTHVDEQILNLSTDSLGFVWQLTPNGLYKFDGISLSKKLGIENNYGQYTTMSLSKEMTLIIGTEQGFLIQFNPYTLSVVSQKWMKTSITSIYCPLPTKECITISYGHGLKVQKGQNIQEFSTSSGLISDEVYEALFIEDEIMAVTDQGLQKLTYTKEGYEPSSFATDLDTEVDIIQTNIFKQGSNIWVSNFDGSIENVDKNASKNVFHLPAREKINELLKIGQWVYVATDGGLYQLIGKDFVKIFPLSGKTAIKTFTVDEEQNLWLATGGNKLVKGSLLFEKINLPFSQIQDLCIAGERIYIGDSLGLLVGNLHQGFTRILRSNITTIRHGEFGNIWLGTFSEGIIVLDKNDKPIFRLPSWGGYEQQSVLSLEIIDKQLYVSSLSGTHGFKFFESVDGVKILEDHRLNDEIGDGFVNQIFKKDSLLYFGMHKQGLRIIDGHSLRAISRYDTGEKLGSVLSMCMQYGVLWFSSSEKGISFLKDGKAHYLKSKETGSKIFSSLIPIDQTRILLIGNRSIEIFNSLTHHIMSFDNEIELKAESTYLNAYDQNAKKIYFAHGNKLLTFDKHMKIKRDPEILFDYVDVNLSNVLGRHVFSESENNVQFRYSASWMTDALKLHYQYMLMGYDTHWRQTRDRTVSYPKLPPGDYTFRVRASETANFHDEPQIEYSIKIKQHFYKNRLFLFALFMASGYFAYIMLGARKDAKLRQLEFESQHIESQLVGLRSQINPHFLFNSFNTLMGLIEENDKERSLKFVENLTDFYRLILEHGKNQLVTFKSEIKLAELYTDLLNERFNNAIQLDIQNDSIDSLIPPLTIQMLVENAVKHNELGGEKKLLISILQKGNFIHIKNNKIKKQYAVASSGSGLENIQGRYTLLSSSSIETHNDEDFFEVILPMIAPYQ